MDFKIFRNRNFSLLVFGQATSVLGTGFATLALSLYVLNMTGSASKFSSILAFGMLPQIVLGSFTGTIVDKINRKTMLILLDSARGVFSILLFAVSIFSQLELWMIYFIVIFFSICEAFFEPALPSIVKKRRAH